MVHTNDKTHAGRFMLLYDDHVAYVLSWAFACAVIVFGAWLTCFDAAVTAAWTGSAVHMLLMAAAWVRAVRRHGKKVSAFMKETARLLMLTVVGLAAASAIHAAGRTGVSDVTLGTTVLLFVTSVTHMLLYRKQKKYEEKEEHRMRRRNLDMLSYRRGPGQ